MRIYVSTLVFALAAVSQAAVDLEWRVENQTIEMGDTVRIGLYAVADNDGEDEPFSSMEAVLLWNHEYLSLLGLDNNGQYDWLYSGFPNDSGLDNLNETFADGNAYYNAWNNFSELPNATPEGMLVTTFEFLALACTDATVLELAAEYGLYSVTAVYDDEIAGLNIVGELGSTSLSIGGTCLADLDGDNDTDLADLAELLGGYGTCVGEPLYNPAADFDGSGCIDISDLAELLGDYGCDC